MARRKRRKKQDFIKEFNQENISFSTSSRANFKRIRDGVEDGDNGAVILRRLRANGKHIANGEFYKTVRLAKAYRQAGRKIKFGRNDRVITGDELPLVPAHLVMRGEVQYIVKLTAGNKTDLDDDGNLKVTYLTIRTGTKGFSKNRINAITAGIADTQKAVDAERYEFMEDNFSVDIVEAYRRV